MYLLWGVSRNWLKLRSFAYSIWQPKWPNYIPKSTFFRLKSTIVFVSISYLYMYLCWGLPRNLLKFGSFAYSIWPPKLWIIFQTPYFQPAVYNFYCKHLIFVYVSLLRSPKKLIKTWLICIFKIMAELSSQQHIFQPAVSNFYCLHLIFVYMYLWWSNFLQHSMWHLTLLRAEIQCCTRKMS